MIPFIVKYEYDDMYGNGSKIVFADTVDEAVEKLNKHMLEKRDKKWTDRVYSNDEFRHICVNAFGWHTYVNNEAVVGLKVREIDLRFGDVIPIAEYFEETPKE